MTNGKSIMVVEDESVVALHISEMLNRMGYNVTATADSGEDAIKKAEEIRPDIVLMDIVLKGEMDGIEAAGQIHSRFNIPVIFLTAYGDEQTLERAKITEPYGYVLKPFKERELRIAIEIALYKHRVESEKDQLVRQLQDALAHIKSLKGLLPICSSCKKIRDDKGYWSQVEVYVSEHSEAEFSHGICPDCAKKLYPDYFKIVYPEKFDNGGNP